MAEQGRASDRPGVGKIREGRPPSAVYRPQSVAVAEDEQRDIEHGDRAAIGAQPPCRVDTEELRARARRCSRTGRRAGHLPEAHSLVRGRGLPGHWPPLN